jgi:hypothetical protein
MSDIQLVNVDGSIPETNPEPLDEELPSEDTPPLKRGRGRPPGAKNRVKAAPEPEQVSEESEPDPEPMPAPKRKSKKRVVVEESSSEEEPPPRRTRKSPPPIPQPDSPRTIRQNALLSSQKQRTDHHEGRVQGYSSILNEMLSY